jgi:hypothetical protein
MELFCEQLLKLRSKTVASVCSSMAWKFDQAVQYGQRNVITELRKTGQGKTGADGGFVRQLRPTKQIQRTTGMKLDQEACREWPLW